jgi:hypothetical protein
VAPAGADNGSIWDLRSQTCVYSRPVPYTQQHALSLSLHPLTLHLQPLPLLPPQVYGGGALYFDGSSSQSTGLLKNCSLLGTVSPKNNDIARSDTSAIVTFACAEGEVGTPVQMSGTEITKLPAPACTTPPSLPL